VGLNGGGSPWPHAERSDFSATKRYSPLSDRLYKPWRVQLEEMALQVCFAITTCPSWGFVYSQWTPQPSRRSPQSNASLSAIHFRAISRSPSVFSSMGKMPVNTNPVTDAPSSVSFTDASAG